MIERCSSRQDPQNFDLVVVKRCSASHTCFERGRPDTWTWMRLLHERNLRSLGHTRCPRPIFTWTRM
jgi:hypothetical protein